MTRKLSQRTEARLRHLHHTFHRAKREADREVEAYGGTEPPGRALRDLAIVAARRYRLALWVTGFQKLARTITA
jgi:hypothetical protein